MKQLIDISIGVKILCKFTPLGFEAAIRRGRRFGFCGVNLPSWGGVKPNKFDQIYFIGEVQNIKPYASSAQNLKTKPPFKTTHAAREAKK